MLIRWRRFRCVLSLLNRSLLNRSLLSLSLLSLMLTAGTNAAEVLLNAEESAHLAEIGQARLCVDPHYAPFEQLDAYGRYTGIAAEFLNRYGELLNVPMIPQQTNSWALTLAWMQTGRCDLIAMINETPSRLEYMDFTNPYLEDDTLIITRDDVGYLEGMNALRGRQVGIVPGYRLEELVRKDYPDIQIVAVTSVSDALQRVSNGELFATFEALRSSLPIIHHGGFDNLKISGQTPYRNIYRIGVRKGDALLRSALNKAIAALPATTAHDIIEHGFKVPIVKRLDTRLLWQVGMAFSALFAFLLYRNHSVGQFNRMLAEKNAALAELSEHDHLTGCYNRMRLDHALQEEFSRAKRYNRPFGAVLMDIDLFKDINDQFGHPVGDAVLIAIAKLLSQQVRQQDYCGRWGGEEFLILCPETPFEQAGWLAEKLRQAVEASSFPQGIRVTASFGVTALRGDDTVASLIQRADQALYQAKHAGRNIVRTAT